MIDFKKNNKKDNNQRAYMQNDHILDSIKTSIEYDKVKFYNFGIVALILYCVQFYFQSKGGFMISYTLLIILAMVFYFNSFANWKTESRLAGLVKLPIEIESVWKIRSYSAIIYLSLFLIIIIVFQILFDNSKPLADKITLGFNQMGVALSGLFLYQLNDDSMYIKSKTGRITQTEIIKKVRLIINAVIVITLIYGGISLSFMSAYRYDNLLIKNQSLMMLATLGIDVLPLLLYFADKKLFLKRKSFIDIPT